MHQQAIVPTVVSLALFLSTLGLVDAAESPPQSADNAAAPPNGAVVLFNGKDLTGWIKRDGKPATWKAENGYMQVVPSQGDIMTKEMVGPDFQLHVEFWIPSMPDKTGQARGNSGVYLQGRYEIQVLDSYHNETYANGSCGALYGLIAPSKNVSKPPEQWQTFDITFHAPAVDTKGKVIGKGRVTVVHNGVTIIDNGTFDRETGGAIDERIASPGPIRLQDHGAPVRYRNIWLKVIKSNE